MARRRVRVGMVIGAPMPLDALGAAPEEALRQEVASLVVSARALADGE